MRRTRAPVAHVPGDGANLRLARTALGLTRSDLGTRLGVPAAAIARLEDGSQGADERAKAAIARALQIPLAVLWGPSMPVLTAWLERPQATAGALGDPWSAGDREALLVPGPSASAEHAAVREAPASGLGESAPGGGHDDGARRGRHRRWPRRRAGGRHRAKGRTRPPCEPQRSPRTPRAPAASRSHMGLHPRSRQGEAP